MQQLLNPYFSPEEVDARRKVAYLNEDMLPELTDPNVDLMTYYVICQSAMDTPAKAKFLRRLED
jgi:hypothetical protein